MEVSEMTIKNCFAKCSIVQQVIENDKTDLDEEFAEIFKELTETNETENELAPKENVDFDNELSSLHPPFSSDMVDQRTKSVQEYCNKYKNKECVELDSEDDEEAHDNDKGNDEQEPFQLIPPEALTMLDSLVHMSEINENDPNALVSIKEKLEKIVINQKKQTNIRGHLFNVLLWYVKT